jgi:hypothetical protein
MARRWRVLGLLLVAAVHGVLLWIYWVPEPKTLLGDEALYWRTALRAAEGGELELPLLWPPLEAHVLAWLIRAFGPSVAPAQILQSTLLVASALLARDVWLRLTGLRAASDLLALWMLAYPPLVAFAHSLWPEVLHLALATGVLWILVARRDSPLWAAGAGALFGLALLAKSILGPFAPVLLAPFAVRGTAAQRTLRVAVAAAAAAAVIAPTLVANLERHGVASIGNSAWFNLWVGLNDVSRRDYEKDAAPGAFGEYLRSAETAPERDAILRRRIADLVAERGAPQVLLAQLGRQYFRLFDKDSVLTVQLPGGRMHERGRGYRDAPIPVAATLRAASWCLYAVLLVTAVAGAALWLVRPPRWILGALLFVAYNLGLFLLLHVKSRYQVPLLPIAFAFSATALQWGCERWRGVDGPARRALGAPGPRGIAAASASAVLLLYLAFGG